MRFALSLLLLFPAVASAQNEKIEMDIKQKLGAIKFVQLLQDGKGGFASGPKDLNPTLKATSAAVRGLKYLTGKKAVEAVPNAKLHTEYVLSCYDPKTGAFAEPGGKPDVTITAIGVMVAAELGIPHDKYAKAMDYLKENAKTFEEVRIGAAAVEAWGVKECPFDLGEWLNLAQSFMPELKGDMKDGRARDLGSATAAILRLRSFISPSGGVELLVMDCICKGQRDDGGWGKKDARISDIETTYRVMRALVLMKVPTVLDEKKLREFLAAHRNKDGGSATEPGKASSMSGVYYNAIITKWLDDMGKK